MKNIFLLLLLITGMVEAQIVSIPDANFKAKLIASGVDFNGNSEIEESEAQVFPGLNLENSNISDLTGIQSFTNLQYLNCSNNPITTALDVSGLINLQTLYCQSDQITSLNASGCTNLTVLDCLNNQITSLNIDNNINLLQLQCSQNQLTFLNTTSNVNLQSLDCGFNQITSLNLSNNSNLEILGCNSNQLSTLDVSNNLNLKYIDCGFNQLTALNVNNNVSLESLRCWVNQLTSLDVTNNLNLKVLHFPVNQISSIIVTSNLNLEELVCSNNTIATIDVTNNLNLKRLECGDNQIVEVNLTNNLNLETFYSFNNLLLTTVLLKNGKIENDVLLSGSPNLTFICADEDQVSSIQASVGSNVVVSSYCFFTPGGNYNTVSGVVRFDMDNNGCDVADSEFPFSVHLNITDGTVSSGTFPTTNGSYSLYTLTGTNTLTTSLENPSYFNISPSSAIIDFLTLGNTQTQDFCITANGVHNDVEIVITPITPARPGFDAVYQIVYKNKGNQTLSGNITFTYDDIVLDFVSATLAPDTQNTGLLNWNYSDLQPFENRSFYVTLNVNSPTETPAVNNGDVLNFEATITPVIGDDIPEDNLFTYNQTVVGSFDPNNITCLEGDVVPASEIGNYLHYAINFENTGTFPAENVVVKTEVDASKFDIGSLQLMNTNFPVDARITGNKVEFIFKNIQLPIGGHGHILLKLKTQNSLVTGDEVANRGDIFFDYNAPIDTGLANTVFQTLSNSVFEVDNSVSIFPNPANNEVTIKADNKIKSIQLYDVQGRIIMTRLMDDLESKLDLSSYSKGIYFVKIITEKGAQVQKLLKE